jgi:hypothetical protein
MHPILVASIAFRSRRSTSAASLLHNLNFILLCHYSVSCCCRSAPVFLHLISYQHSISHLSVSFNLLSVSIPLLSLSFVLLSLSIGDFGIEGIAGPGKDLGFGRGSRATHDEIGNIRQPSLLLGNLLGQRIVSGHLILQTLAFLGFAHLCASSFCFAQTRPNSPTAQFSYCVSSSSLRSSTPSSFSISPQTFL